MTEFSEGDIDSKERGTCARSNGGKACYSLVPMHLLYGAARVFVYGVRKYAQWNWAKGGRWSTAFDCLVRHLFKWWFCGEECDKESGLHHLDHAMCNLLFLIHYRDTYREGDDRPPSHAGFLGSLDRMSERYEIGPMQHGCFHLYSEQPCDICPDLDGCIDKIHTGDNK